MDTRNYDEPDNFGLGDCNCSEDNNCGCSFPNNIKDEGFSPCTAEDHYGRLNDTEDFNRGEENDVYFNSANIHFDALSCDTIFCSQIKTEHFHDTGGNASPATGILIRTPAPDFFASAVMPDGKIDEGFHLSEYLNGYYGLIFFYPMDFTFVCPSEMIALDRHYDEFAKRNVKIVAVSIDSVYAHRTWRKIPVEKGGIGDIRFPLVSDITKSITGNYRILNEDGTALRASFLIDRDGLVRHLIINDPSIGRNVDEILKAIDALQFTEKSGNVCPAGWYGGEEENPAAPKDDLPQNEQKL